MPERFGFKPSEMGPGLYIRAECLSCRESRYLGRQMMIDRAGDIPLRLIEPRLRCVARPLSNKRGPACGGRMVLEFHRRASGGVEARASTVEEADDLARFAERMKRGSA